MKILSLLFALISLTACAASTELPQNNGDESDVMKPSPCACVEIDYNSRGFKWLS